jgi:hypothetical protein
VERQLEPDAAAGGVPDPVDAGDAEPAQQLSAAAGVRGDAGLLGRRRAAAVAGPDRPDHPEPVQRRLLEQRREPFAEDAGVDEADHLAGAAVVVVETGEAVHCGPPPKSIRVGLE